MRLISRFAAGLAVGIIASCASPTEPTADLGGEWVYSFSSVADAAACPAAPPGFRAGCSGAGPMTLTQDGTTLSGSVTLAGSCQSCMAVADFRGPRAVVGRWRGGDIEIDIGDCRHTAAVPPDATFVRGSVNCTFGGIPSSGEWSMRR